MENDGLKPGDIVYIEEIEPRKYRIGEIVASSPGCFIIRPLDKEGEIFVYNKALVRKATDEDIVGRGLESLAEPLD